MSSEAFLTGVEITEDFDFGDYDQKQKERRNFLFGAWEVDKNCQQETSERAGNNGINVRKE